MEDKIKAAVAESRIIHPKEMNIRKNVGYAALGLIAFSLFTFPSTRQSYAGISLALAAAIGTWRTGNQALWGCVVNLKWNFDGKGFKTPSDENLEFVRGKRNELFMMGLTTSAAVVIGAIGLAAMRGHASPELVIWILAYNAFGLAAGYGVSSLAKWKAEVKDQTRINLIKSLKD